MIYYFISNYGFIDSEVNEGQIDPPKFAFRTKVAAESYFDLITPKELREDLFYEYGDEDNIRAARVTGHPDIVFEVTVNLEDWQTYFLGIFQSFIYLFVFIQIFIVFFKAHSCIKVCKNRDFIQNFK
jgi:hypothetical protein